jgi:hypothetical protein
MTRIIGRGIAIVITAVFILSLPVNAASIEYLDLKMRGNEMSPAILDGDTVRVKICTDGSLIKVGPKSSTNPGDIIVYCAGAAVSQPSSMWMCGRAISKYYRDGHWYFKTEVDNSSEADPWEVPDHFLLGVVAEVVHSGNSQSAPLPSYTESDTESSDLSTVTVEFAIGVTIGFIFGLAAKRHLPKVTRLPIVSNFPASSNKEPDAGPDPDRNRLTFGSPFLALFMRMPELAEMYRERKRY